MSRSHGRNRATRRSRLTLPSWMSERHGEWRLRWNRSLLMGSTGLSGVLAGLALGAGSAWSQMAPNTLPSGGQVVAGSAAINQANPSTLNITQSTSRAVINWNSFDVGSSASVNFYQPDANSWTLNRVTNSVSPSQILGSITANGNIAVINPNGVIFGAGSRIDVNGLIATTANITDQNFMAGNMKFDQAGNPTATVSNFGDITVKDAGLVAFVAPGVQNSGTITARLGTVSLAAGQRFTIDLYGDKLVSIATDGAVDQAPVGPDGKPLASLVDNSGKIVADGGQVLLTARQASRIVDTAVNMSGVVQAQSAYVDKNGDIVLDAGPAGDVKVTGTLDASGRTPGTKGGNVTVTGKNDVIVGSTATLNASGDAGGGKIKIGGDLRGQGTTPTAKRTLVATGAQVTADATTSGDGGTIVVWSDENTQVGGMLSVLGGMLQGNGGLIETSSKGDFMVAGSADIRLAAPNGLGGTWLLDPQNIIVASSGASGGPAGTVGGNDQFSDNGNTNTILASTVVTALGSGNVTLQAVNDITVSSAVNSSANSGSLTLRAGRDVNINASINTGTGTFTATANDSGAGTSFSGPAGGNNGRKDSTSGDFVMASGASITAASITINITNSTSAITFSSGGPLAYNPGSATLYGLTATGASGNVVINATSTVSNATVNSTISAKNNIAFNVGGSVTLANNLTADSDSAGGGALSGTAPSVYVANNTAQIGDAVAIVNTNGTVTLASNTSWTELVSIGKAMSLQGGTNSVIDGSTLSGSVISVNASGGAVVIDKVGVLGNNANVAAVLVGGASSFVFSNGTITGTGTATGNTSRGIAIGDSVVNATVAGSTISNVVDLGVLAQNTGWVVVNGNTIFDTAGGAVGVSGIGWTDVQFMNNRVAQSGGSMPNAFSLSQGAALGGRMTISGNTLGSGSVPFTGTYIIGIAVSNATGTVSGNTLSNILGADGILVGAGSGALNVLGNTITIGGAGSGDGIHITTSGGMTVSGNTIVGAGVTGSGSGIFADDSSGTINNLVVASNTISAFGKDGVLVDPVFGPVVFGNVVFNVGGSGIEIDSASGSVSVANNIVNATGSHGIYVHDTSGVSGNTISIAGNTIGNDNGLGTISGGGIGGHGIFVDGGTLSYGGATHIEGNRVGVDTDGPLGVLVAGTIAGNGIFVDSGSSTLTGIIVSGNSVAGFTSAGILIDPAADPVVTGNTVTGPGTIGIEVADAIGSVTVTGNYVDNVDTGISVHDTTGDAGDTITIGGNTIGRNSILSPTTGITLTNNNIGGTIASNSVSVSGDGIDVAAGGQAWSVSDNSVSSSGSNATLLYVSGAGQLAVEDNFFGGKSIGGSANGIRVDVDPTLAGQILIGGNTVESVKGNAVFINGSTVANANYTVTGNTLSLVGGNGVHVDGGGAGTKLTVSSNTITGGGTTASFGSGVLIDSGALTFAGATVSDNVIGGFNGNGIYIDPVFGPVVTGNDIANVVDNGIEIVSPVGGATILSNTINATGENGIYVHGATGLAGDLVTIAGNTIGNDNALGTIGGGGIVGDGNSGFLGDIVVSNNRIGIDTDGAGTLVPGAAAGSGISLVDSGGGVTVAGNTIANPAQSGITIANATGQVDVGGNTISNADGYGVLLSTVGGSTIASNVIAGGPVGVAIFGGGPSTISNNAISVTGVTSAAGITIDGTSAPMQILFNDIKGGSAGTGIDLADGQFTITNNNVNGFASGLHVASGTTVGNATVITNLVFGNNFSGNTIGVDHEGSGVIQASGNYWGLTSDNASFQSYFAHNAALTVGGGEIDVTPFLVDGTDGNGATVGFVGNFRQLFVTALGSQLNGPVIVGNGRIQEAVDLIPTGVGTNSIEIGSGTFLDNVTINRADITNLKLFGQGAGSTAIDGYVNSQAVISVAAIGTANAGDLTFQDFAVTGTTGGSADGIVTSTISHVLVDGVYATSLTNAIGFDFVGGSDIVVTGASIGPGVGKDGVSFNGSSNVSVTASTIAGIGRDGIAMVSVAGGTIGNNVSIGGVTRDGIRVLDSTGVSIGNGVSINAAGRDGVRVQADGPNASVSLGGVTIVNATDNGVDVIAGGGGTASAAFTGGTSISNNVAGAFNAVRVQGANASFTLPTPDGTTDLSLNIDAGDSLQNYFLLTNGAMGGTVTLGYDVNFIGLTGTLSSLQTYGLTAATLNADQIAALFQIEDHMVHAVDNTSLGLIRLIPDALFPTTADGLNGVRNAILLSDPAPSAQDTVFLQAGIYADPSNQVGGGINIDRNIKLVGAEAGISVAGRDPTDAGSETILDFNSATVTPNNGIRITDPAGGAGVLIDGVVVQVGSNQGYGIRIDTGAARDNISIVNSFVRGMSGNNATGDGIQTAGGGSTVNGVTISGDVIEYFNGDGVDLANVGGLVLQNNAIRNVAGRGIDVTGSGFATSLSGNTLSAIGLDGIRVQNAITAVMIDGNAVADTADGDGIEVDGATMGATIVGNSIAATSGNVTINGNGIRVDNTTAGGVLVSGNLVGTAEGSKVTGDGIHVQDTVLGGVSVSLNIIGSDRSGALVSGDGIQIVDTGIGGSGNVFVLSNSIQHTGGDGVFVDPTIGDVTVNGQNILSVGGNGIRVFQTTGKVTVGDTGAGNTVNVTGKNGILVDTTGEIPGPIAGTGGVTVSYNLVGNIAGTTIGSAGSFDGIVVTDTLRGNVLVSGNSVAAGNNVVVTRQGIYVVDTAGQGATGGNVTVQGNTVAAGAGAGIVNSGILVDNTTLGSAFVSDNAIALGDGAAIGSDAIRVQDTGADASVSGNAIGNGTTAIGAEGIEVIGTTGTANVDGNTVFNVSQVGVRLDNNGHATVADNTIDATGQAGILVLDTADGVLVDGNMVGVLAATTINGSGIFIDQTAAGSVTVSNNQVATGAGATLANDAIRVDHTSLGNVFVLSNQLGNAGFANPNEGIDVANTSAGGATVNGNSIVNFQGFGIHVAQTYGMVAVGTGSLSGNTIDLTGLDGIRVNDTGVNGGLGGVLVGGNLIGSTASSTIGGLGIFVDQTAAGSVTVSANSVATGAGAALGNDAIRIDHTSLGNVLALGNSVGNIVHGNPNDAIDIANTSAGGVTVNGNHVVDFLGYGIHIAQTYGRVVVGADSLSGNTVDATDLDAIRVNDTGVDGGPGGVLVAGNIVADFATIGASGIVVMDSKAGSVTVLGNSVGQGGHVMGDGIRVAGTSIGGVTVSGNLVGSSVSGAGIDNDGIQVTNTGLGVLLDGNSVTNVGFVGGNGRGIVVNITGLGGNGDSTISNSTVSGTGGVGILAQSIGGNLLANAASVSHTGDSGIRVDRAGNVTASNLTIDSAGNHGLHLRNIANGTVSGATVTNATNDGLRLSRPDGSGPSMAVSIANVTIDGAGAVGLRLLDNDGTIGGGTIALQVGSGVSIANAPIGVIVDGPDTRNIGKSLNDMSFANIGSGSGYYIELRNAGWYEDDSTPNGAFNPTQIDATHVSFDGVVAGSLDPANNSADVVTLANLELRLFHFLDDPTLGLIRLQAHAIALPEMGLNGIQLADYASANGDSIYLIAGTYGDPSSLVPGGLVIDKQISLVGWQHGVPAKSGGRDGVTDETILDFAGATIAPSAGIVIKESNVTIDGVVVQLDASQVNGGIVVDTSVARSNIDIVNNIVHGTSIAFGGGAGILTSGAGTVTNLNVSDNLVEFVTGNGISIDHGQNLTIQNNVLGNAAYGAVNLNNGIFVTNSSFGAPVSGNVVSWTGAAGISVDGVSGTVSIADNSLANTALSGIIVQNAQTVDVSGNALADIGTNGIVVQVAGDTYVTGNTLTSIGIIGIGAVSVGNATIADNTVAHANGSGIGVDHADAAWVLDNDVNATGLQGIVVSNSPSVDIEGNTINGAGFDGILASSVGELTVAGNSVGGSALNGIEVQNAGGTSIMGNTLAHSNQDGIVAVSVGNVTVADNTLSYSGGNGIVVESADGVRVLDNSSSYQTLDAVHIDGVAASTVAGNTLSYAGGDGIDLANGGTTTLSGNGVSYVVGNGVVVNTVGQLDIVDNSVGNTTLAGVTVYNAAATNISGNSVFYALGGDGIAAVSVGGLTIAGNDVEYASANGIAVFHAGDMSASGNTIVKSGTNGIAALSVGSTTIAGNVIDYAGAAGVTLSFAGDASILTNTIVGQTGDGIDVTDSGATSISGNTIGSGGAKGIYATGIHGGLTVLNNDLDTIAGNGIEASTVFGDVTVSSNLLHDVTLTGIRTSNTGNVQANGNSLDLIGGDGIVISLATSDASVQGNTLSHISGNGIIVGQLTDTTITGNVLSSIAGTGIAASQINDATVGGNSLTDIGNDGINLSQANDLVVGANQMARVAGDGIDIALAHDVTVVANILDDTGHGAGGAAVRLDNYTMATIVGNSIVSLTAMTGIAISNGTVVTYPQGNTTIAGNLISGNEVGIGTGGEVLGTITGNTITGNSQWGIVVGAGLTQTHLEGSMMLLNLLVTGNIISGNGVPLDHTLVTGGVRNDNIGLVLDARGNDWGDASGPYAGPTHFLQSNPNGKGNAVSDWVLYDVHSTPTIPPMVPPFGSLLDSFERGSGHPHTPGDVLAIGPGFTYNGALFDPYFFDLFQTAFALAEIQGGGNFAIDYAVCHLGDMWKADSCKIAPGSKP